MIKKLLALLLLLHPWLAAENCIVVGTNGEFPPFSFIENKKLVGFDIDVATEVGARLGKTIQFKDMPFEALIPAISLGHVDFAAAGFSYTPERAKRVSFTKSYISDDPLVILSKQSLDLDDLKGKTVIVIEGFTADYFMSSKPGINLIRLPTQADGFMAITCDRADAFVTAKSTVEAFFQVQKVTDLKTTLIENTGETCSIVVPKNNLQLLIDIQHALDEMQRDGTFAKLKAKWNLK